MADVGVLNLTIHDNSEEAAKGLDRLTGALESVQKAVGGGLNLSGIVGPLNRLTSKVNDSKSLANIGTFLKSLTSYYDTFKKIGDASQKIEFNTAPIEQLKAAIGEGLHIGKAGTELEKLRISLDKSWNVSASEDVKTVLQNMGEGAAALPTNLGTKAGQLAKFADALREFASASGEVKGAIGHGIVLASTSQFESVGNDAGDGMAKGIQEAKDKVARAAAEMTQAGIESARETQDSHSPAVVYEVEGNNAVDGYVKGIVEKTTWAAGQVSDFIKNCVSAAQGNEQVAAAASESFTRAFVSSFMGNMDIPEAVKAKMVQASEAIGAVTKDAFASANGNYDQVADAVAALARNTLTGVVNASIGEIKQGFAEASSAKLPADFMPIESATQFRIELQETGNTITSVIIPRFREMYEIWSKMAYAFGMFENETVPKLMAGPDLHRPVAEDQMLSTHVDNWKPDWIFGEGTVRETTAQLEIVSNAMNETEESAKAAREAIKQMFAVKPESFEDVFNGVRHGKKVENDLMSNWLHGNGTKGEQEFALKSMARQFSMTVDEVKAKIAELKAATNSDTGMSKVLSMMDMSRIDLLTAKLNDYINTTEREYNAGKLSEGQMAERVMTAQRMRDEIMRLSDAENEAAGASSGLNSALASMKEGMKRAFPTISSLLNRFKQIVKYRMLRTILRQITSGISEGVKNVYYYSQAVGTSFAPSMDAAATSLLQMKNSIGAALAPAIQALVPVLQTVVSWFITLVNYVNQFFALLRGQSTWTRALPQATTAFKDQTKAAKGASNAMKDLLADWDELNIIQSQSGSGGGGASGVAEDYATMFEEVSTYDTWIGDLVSGIEEKFGSVLDLVKRIGVIIGAWKISQIFSDALGTIAGLVGAAVTLDVVFNLVNMFSEKYLKTGETGWLVGNALTTLFGAAITKKILGKVLNGKIASYAIPVTLFVSALADAVAIVNSTDVTALSKENLVTSVLSATKTGLGAGYLLYKVGGFTNFTDLAGVGGGVALMTFGVLVGLRAIKDTVNTRAITKDTIQSDLLSAGAFGGGIGLIAGIMGVGLAGVLGLAGGAALLTFGALIAIEAIIASEPKAVQWGDINATQEAIKAWVEDEKNGVFTASPKAILSVIDPLIEVKSTEEEGLKTTVENVKVIAKKISLGINEDSALKDLEHQIFGNSETGDTGLIGKFKSTAKAHEEIIETGLTIVPITANEDGTVKEIISRQSDAWQMLTGHMDDLGRELWGHMQTAYSESVDEGTKRMELKTISDLTAMMVNVSAAITQGEQYENAMLGLEENLENLSEGSWNSLFDYIAQYKEEIVAAYTKAYDEVTVSMAGLTAGLQQSMENERYLASTATTESEREKHLANAKAYEDEYNYWFAELTSRREGRQAAIEQAAKDAENEETYARIRKILADKINKDLIDPSDVRGFDLAEDAWTALFDLSGARTTFAKDQVTNWLDDLIDISFGDDADTIKKAVHLGMLGYNDIFQESVIAELASEIGITGQDAKVQTAWNNLIKELFGEGYSVEIPKAVNLNTRGVETGAEEMMKHYKELVIENIDKTKIDPSDVSGLGLSDDLWTALFNKNGESTSFAKGQIESWLDSLIDASFGSDASIVKEAVHSGMRGYDDVFSEAVVHALAEKIGIPGQSKEVIDAWNRLVEETFGSGYGVVVEPEVIVKPKVKSSSLDNAIEQVKGALKDGVLARYEKDALINALGSELFEQALASIEEELGNVGGEYKSKSFGGGSTSPLGRIKERALEQARIVAHGTPATANVTGVDYNAIPYVGKTQPEITEADIANGVANGTARGNAEQNVLLRDAVNYLMRIAAKDFSVNINPSTLFARTANASENMYTKVTGG